MNPILREDFDRIHHKLGAKLTPLRNKSILVTGANGMLAGYMVQFFSYLHSVHAFPLKVFGLVREIKNDFPGVRYLLGDVNSVPLHERFDFIVHAASLGSPIHYGTNPIGVSLPNVVGTTHLLKHAEAFPVESFLFVSSSEVYGDFGTDKTAIEESEFGRLDPMNPRSCYAESKRMGESLCVSWLKQKGVPTKVVRPFHTYGPGITRTDGRVYADFIYSIVDSKDIVLNSSGEARRAFCYQSDALIGMLLVLLEGQNGEAYNLGNPHEEHSIREAAEIATSVFPERKMKVAVKQAPTSGGYLKSAVLRNCPSISKIGRLGWTPEVSLKSGLERSVRYIEGNS